MKQRHWLGLKLKRMGIAETVFVAPAVSLSSGLDTAIFFVDCCILLLMACLDGADTTMKRV